MQTTRLRNSMEYIKSDGQTDRWMDRQTDTQTDTQTHRQTHMTENITYLHTRVVIISQDILIAFSPETCQYVIHAEFVLSFRQY